MGFLTASESFSHSTVIQGVVSKEQALKALQDHAFLLSQDSLAVSHKEVDPPNNINYADSRAEPAGQAKFYEQTFTVPGIIARLLPGMGHTTNQWRMENTRDGLVTHMTGALNVSVDREFVLTPKRDAGDMEDWTLLDRGTIQCSKLMMGPMKKRLDEQWQGIHRAYVNKMGAEVGTQA